MIVKRKKQSRVYTRAETRARFAKKVEEMGGEEAAALVLGVSRSAVRSIGNGERNPRGVLLFKIQQSMEIPMADWFDGRDFPKTSIEIKRAG